VESGSPPPPGIQPLRLLPLGGLGEIGMNTLLIEHGEDALCLDCGVTFPDETSTGIDVILPDLSPIWERQGRLRGYVLTHAHEDHIGALPYAVRQAPAPVYGTPFTLALVREKLTEHQIAHGGEDTPVPLRRLDPGVPVQLGDSFIVEAFRVTHSIVDSVGLAITTPAGLVVHSGDFKIDHTPIDDQPTDLSRLAALGQQGVALLLSDSTNVERSGHVASEREVGALFEDIFEQAEGRVLVTLFASHIHRIQQFARAAVARGRSLAFEGRSLSQNVRLARELGVLDLPSARVVDLGEAASLPPRQVAIIVSGSQGEPRSALARLANDDHPTLHLLPGDTVVFSSRTIPGHERTVARLVDRLYRRGARVIYEALRVVHTSGHGAKEELKLMIRLCQPRNFVPVHGAYRHLWQHAQLAGEMGVPHRLIAENGDVLELEAGGEVRIAEHRHLGRFYVDSRGEDLAVPVVRDRRALSQTGMVTVVVVLDGVSGEVLRGPEVHTKGLYETEPPDVIQDAQGHAAAALQELSAPARGDVAEVKEMLRKSLRSFFRKLLDRKPVVLPIVIEL
jgi:ribonuclease J